MTPDLFNTTETAYGPSYEPIKPADPNVPAAEAPRLSGQCALILDMLRRGRVSNVQMAAVALKYTNRIHDLRTAGFDIKLVQRDHPSGLNWYALFENGVEIQGCL